MEKILDLKRKCLNARSILLFTILFLNFNLISKTANSANTGYEAWYHYIGGVVNAANGNLFLSYKDISLKARGFDLQIVRSYNSLRYNYNGPFGYGWTFNYNVYLVDNGSTVNLYDGDGSVHTYTSTGDGNYSSPPGVHSQLKKDGGGFLLRFKNGCSFRFNLSGQLLNIADRNGNELIFSYSSGKLATISDESGLSLTFIYNAQNRISRATDSTGRQINYGYDGFGNLTSVTDAGDNPSVYLYYGNHLLMGSVDQVGAMLHFSYDTWSNKVAEIKTSLYNFGTQTYLTPLRLYLIEYDFGTISVTDALKYKTTIQVNALGNPTQIVDARNGHWFTNWDSDMNIRGLSDAKGRIYEYNYDTYGNLVSQIDPLEHSTTYAWENTDNETKYISLLTSITDRLNHTTSYSYDANGNLTQITDAIGNTSHFYYNSHGYPERTVDFKNFQTLYSYDTHGNMSTVTNAIGAITSFGHDPVGRLISITDPLIHTTVYQYNNNNDQVTNIINALNYETMYTYNAAGSLVNRQDAKSNNTTLIHNILGVVDQTTDALNNHASSIFDRTANGIGITDAKNHKTTPSYDALGRITSIRDPLGYTESYGYDAVGNRISKRDKKGSTITYGYNALNLLESVNYPDDSSVTIQHDAEGNITQIINTGGLQETTTYLYDNLNHLVSLTVDYGEFIKTIGYSYDANGNRETMTDPNGGITTYGYDNINRLISITNPSSDVTTYEYDAADRRTKVIYPNGTYTTCTYDDLNRILSATNHQSSGSVFSSYSYTYDGVGNRLSANSTNYGYDSLYRLTHIDTGNISYTYDAVGNRMTKIDGSTTTYTYDANDRLIYSSDGTSYTYDNNGNMFSKTKASSTKTYIYDWENRLSIVTFPDSSQAIYIYSATGDRLAKIAGGVTSYYLYDFEDVLMEMDASGAEVARYTHGPGIDEPISMNRGGSSSFYHYDGLGSVTSLTNSSQNVTSTYAYDPFGKITSQTGTTVNPYKFTGREYDQETELYYYKTRHYAPDVGRFVGANSINFWNNPLNFGNGYTFAENNPLNRKNHPETPAKEFTRKIIFPDGRPGIARWTDPAYIVIELEDGTLLVLNGLRGQEYLDALEEGLPEGYHFLLFIVPEVELWKGSMGSYAWWGFYPEKIPLMLDQWFNNMPLSSFFQSDTPVFKSSDPSWQSCPDISINQDRSMFVPANLLKSVPSGGGNSIGSIDNDKDGVSDFSDNCPDSANPGQQDSDGDGIGDSCDTSGGDIRTGCFLAGTSILMADGTKKPIEKVRVGDTVFAFDEKEGKLKPDRVSKIFRHPKEDTYLIVNDHLKVTPIHPVLSKGKWVSIGTLKVGDTLTDEKGKDVPIKDIKAVKEKVSVYNFEVNPYHTYIADGYIVHNRKPNITMDYNPWSWLGW